MSLARVAIFGAVAIGGGAIAACAAHDSRPAEHVSSHGAASASHVSLFDGEIKEDDMAHFIREHFTKYEARIPMRDGVHLFTQFYVPKDDSRTYPIMYGRTPYGIGLYGLDAYAKLLTRTQEMLKRGYIFAVQDVRGKFQSEGVFADVRPYIENKSAKDTDETTDAYDSIDWLVKNAPKNNGRVGTMGTSYPGFYAAMAVIDAHPALKAASPQAPIADWFLGDDMHHNGALFLAPSFAFFAEFSRLGTGIKKWPDEYDYPTTDGYDFYMRMGPLSNSEKMIGPAGEFFRQAISHESYDDFWKARATVPHLKNVKPAVMTVGGWFDAEDLYGTLATYRAIEAQGAKSQNTIVMGPWRHGGWSGAGESLGNVNFGAKTGDFFREKIMARFFEATLQEGAASPLPEAWAFQTGTNEWKTYDAWPPKNAHATAFYLREGESLSKDAPAPAKVGELADSYVSDPEKPVPYRETPSNKMDAEYMTDDQRFASRRPDVVVYRTEVLAEDLAIAGPIDVTLFVTTSGTDSDFVVKVVDVYGVDAPDPDPNPKNLRMAGYEQLLRGDVFRGRFRDGFGKPAAFRPNEPARIHFTMPDVNHVFRAGHRMMVQAQSSWFPLVDRNPQTFVDIHTAKQGDFIPAEEHILRDRDHASCITVSILK